MTFEIFADSGCDIPVEMMNAYNIHPVYFYVSFDGETYKKEKLEVDTTAYYKKMIDENAFPKTSLPSVQDYVDAFTPVLENGTPIICICMSGKLSGSHQAAKTARDILLETYPKAHIKVIESKMCTVEEGLFVLEAVRMRDAGLSYKEAVARLKELLVTGRICFTVGNLEHLKRGGRIGKVAFIAGSALGIKPLIVMKDGEIFSGGIARNKPKALKKLLEIARDYFEKAGENPNDYRFCIGMNIDHDEAQTLAKQVKDAFWLSEDVPVWQIGATVATHAGPYALGFAFVKKYDPANCT